MLPVRAIDKVLDVAVCMRPGAGILIFNQAAHVMGIHDAVNGLTMMNMSDWIKQKAG
ncbi:MAG TPA: hypothetical protein VG962_14490 [Steroidobacteraceae bacterium]|nr:hypothetical protein [Steroidobacteraceae bacterium]